MPDVIDDPLWDLMLSTHSCHPDCCGDFQISTLMVLYWLDDFGDEFGRTTLGQVDELVGRAPAVGPAITSQCGRRFGPRDTVESCLGQWRSAIVQALREYAAAEVLTVEEATARVEAARRARFDANRTFAIAEQRVRKAAESAPEWPDRRSTLRAQRKVARARRAGDEAALRAAVADLEATSRLEQALLDQYRVTDADHAAAARVLHNAERNLFEAERRLKRAEMEAAAAG